MPLDNLVISPEDLVQTQWQQSVAKPAEKTCDAYHTVFRAKAVDAATNHDEVGQRVYEFLFHICSLRLSLDTPTAPFAPMFPLAPWASAGIGDFTSSHLDCLQTILPSIADAELTARIADILWIRKHGDYLNAQTAVNAYLQSAMVLEDPEKWVDCAHRIERALQIATQLGEKNSVFQKVTDWIESTLDKYHGEDPLFLSAHLMKLLLNARKGDCAKYAALCEKAAQSAEASSGGLKWHRARTYWEVKAAWHSRDSDEESSRAALLKAGETYVKEAEDALRNPSQTYAVAAFHIQHAIEALRRIAGTELRREELHRLLITYQKKSGENLKPISMSIDVSRAAEQAVELVRGKALHEALALLALGSASPNVQVLRERVEKQIRSFGLGFWLSATLVDPDGKTQAKRPGLGTPNDNEMVIRQEMFREAQREQSIFADAIVRPAVIQINADHYFREVDLLPIVVNNPFVPPGREMVFARGLCAGLMGDMLVASHILLPQIENSIRHVLQQRECLVSGLDANLIQDEYPLNKVIYEFKSDLQTIFGEDLLFDLQGLLIERFGSNLRNLVAHGLLSGSQFVSGQMLYLWWLTLRLCCLPICSVSAEQSEASVSSEAPQHEGSAEKGTTT